jgi:exopolyphosphatase / guanosine-5'-triphosphate,3'-diphosphate pyrophosphatase
MEPDGPHKRAGGIRAMCVSPVGKRQGGPAPDHSDFRKRVRAPNLLATAPKAGTLRLILEHEAACTSAGADVGAPERHRMDDEGQGTGGLEPAPYRRRAENRANRGRGHHFRHRRASTAGAPGRGTYAALDLGTNNCRLLIARPSGDGFRVIDAFSRIIRLGEGLSATGRLSEAAIVRAVGALAVCRDKMVNRGVTRARLIATEACRVAVNGAEFLEVIRKQVGIELEIVDRKTEADLAATGCTPLIDPQARGVLLFDIGGGSSELVSLAQSEPAMRGPPRPVVRSWVSLPVGVVTLAERHGGVRVDRALFEAMVDEVAIFVAPFTAAHGGNLDGVHMLGTSGTVTTIAGIHLRLPRYDRRRVDGCWLSDIEISGVIDELIAMTYEQRVANACIGSERADLVLAGCAILEAIRRAFPCPRLRVADRGLREGILVKLMREDGVWSYPGGPA